MSRPPVTTSARGPDASLASARARATLPTASGSPSLETISLFNPTAGYGLFQQQQGGFCDMAVAKTTDGGANFAVPVPVAPCGAGGGAGSVAFDNHGDGFAYGPSLYVTHDGGTTWRPDPQPGQVVSVEALGYSVWMLEADCAKPETETTKQLCPLQVYESTNGGRSWAPSPVQPPSVSTTAGRPSRLGGASLVRVSTTSAYVLGAPTTPMSAPNRSTPGTVPLDVTADGGRSWNQRVIPCGPDAVGAVMSAAPTGTLVAVCGWFTQVHGQEGKAVLVSTDEGASWSRRGSCASLTSTCFSRFSTNDLGAGDLGVVEAVSSTVAYEIGLNGPLLKTTDGGAVWTSTGQVNDGGGSPTTEIFFDPLHGVILANSHLWHTTDGGQSWSQWTDVAARPPSIALHGGRIAAATLPASIRRAVRPIDERSTVPLEMPYILPPSLSARAKVTRAGYSVSLFGCPRLLRFGTPAIGSGGCRGLDKGFGTFGGRREASPAAARAALAHDAKTPLGCPKDKKLVRHYDGNPRVIEIGVSRANGATTPCELTWKEGTWRVEVVGTAVAGGAATIPDSLSFTFAYRNPLPGSAGLVVIEDTLTMGARTHAWWRKGAVVYDANAYSTPGQTASATLSLASDMTPVASGG